MVRLDEAQRIASQFLRNRWKEADTLVIVEGATRTESFGWVFFWNAERYIATGDARYAIEGNLPVVVLRDSGEASFLPHRTWTKDMDSSIRAFARSLEQGGDHGT